MKLLKFYAPWCQPCKRLGAYLDTQVLEVEIDELNVEENSTLASQYDIMSVPVLIVLDDNGEELARHPHSDPKGVEEFLTKWKCL